MKIIYQGKVEETSAATVAEFLEGRVRLLAAVVEYKGEAYPPGADLSMPLEDGAELNVFHMVAGG